MALTELVSNLSAGIWNPEASPQGSTPARSPFAMPIGPGSSNTPINAIGAAPSSTGQSLFLENTTANIGTFIRFRPGFNNFGFFNLGPGYRESKDNYPIFTALGESGTSRRMNQGGIGFPFPIGPTGNVYDWKPNAHTGWNKDNKYNDNIGAIYGNSGLADTYTTNSPIDDIYNKVKVRSAAWNKNSFGLATDQPFILRGIQRDNNSDPQYWGGFADTLTDIPRGGITTAVEREAVDKARIGKFMISPKGLIFQAKQFGLQLMNPNVEGVTGFWTGVTPRSNKIYNPLSVFSLNAPVPFHVRRDSFDPSGLTSYNYESVIKERNILGFGTRFNRLTTLHTEAFNGFGLGPLFNTPIGLPYLTITDLTGPKSVLGIGITSNKRYTNTSLRQSKLLNKPTKGLRFVTTPYSVLQSPVMFAGVALTPVDDGSTYDITRYKDDNTYTSPDALASLPGPNLAREYNSPLTKEEEAEWAGKGIIKLRETYDEIKKDPAKSKVLGKNDGNIKDIGKRYATVAYGDLNRTTTDGSTSTITPNDFRDNVPLNRANYGLEFSQRPKNTGVGKNAKDKEYKDSNLVKRIGIGDYGDLNTMDRSNPRYVIDNKATVITSHKEKADQLVLGNSTKDLVKFVIAEYDKPTDTYNTVARFRSYIDSVSMTISTATGELQQAYARIKEGNYDSTSRNLSIDFKVPVLSAVERERVMNSLNTLAKIGYGDSVKKTVARLGGGTKTTLSPVLNNLKLIIGNYTKIYGYIETLSFDIDTEYSWDIDHEQPMIVNVSMTFKESANSKSAEASDYTNGLLSGGSSRVIG